MWFVAALTISLALVQIDRTPARSDEVAITVRGCVQGASLKVTTADTEGVRTAIYRLKMSKEIKNALKEHEGHEEEVSGVLLGKPRGMGGTKTTPIGERAKIFVGADEHRAGEPPSPPEIEVDSVEHVASACRSPQL